MYKTSAFDDNANEYDRWYDGNKEIYKSKLLALKQVISAGKRGLEVDVDTTLRKVRTNLLSSSYDFFIPELSFIG